MKNRIIKPAFEVLYKEELLALQSIDKGPKPENWKLSPRRVKEFIIGRDEPIKYKDKEIRIEKKFYGDDALVERCIVTLAGNRGLMLVGEPGTAKSMLSELLSAAISNDSTYTIQGTAGTTEDMIKYTWNYAMLIAKGPSNESLIPSPVLKGLEEGKIVRLEEITRCPSEIQDSLISIMSDKVIHIPELNEDSAIYGKSGFNIIATANIRDKGVNEMSSALKRRFNFETVFPVSNMKLEMSIIEKEAKKYYMDNDIDMDIDRSTAEVLAMTFHELRNGLSKEGGRIEKPDAIMSTAEAVSVYVQSALGGYYYDDGRITMDRVVQNIMGAVIKENRDDLSKLRNYFNHVIKSRSKEGNQMWKDFYRAKSYIK